MMSVRQRIDRDSHRDPDVLEREAEAARKDIVETVDELEERLSPGRLLDRAVDAARAHGGEFAGNLGRQIKYHPVPLMLTAVGITWLALADESPPVHRDGADGSRRMARAGTAARDAVRSARDGVRDGVRHTAESIRHGATRAAGSLREHPFVLGAMGLAVGALIGAGTAQEPS